MPIYGYRCDACGAETEKRQSFHDDPLTTCEQCGGSLRRLLHPAGIVFKGSGFYNTDYRKNGGSATKQGETSKSGSESSSTDTPSTSTSSNGESSSSSKPAPAKTESSTPAKSSSDS